MKEYLDPRTSLENKARDALKAECEWDANFLNLHYNNYSFKDSSLLSGLDNSYVALAVYIRFRKRYDDPEIFKDVRIFYKNFKKAIDEKDHLSGEGILKYARASFAVWNAFVQNRILNPGADENWRKEQVSHYVSPFSMGVNRRNFEDIRDSLVNSGYRLFASGEKHVSVPFDEKKPIGDIVEALSR